MPFLSNFCLVHYQTKLLLPYCRFHSCSIFTKTQTTEPSLFTPHIHSLFVQILIIFSPYFTSVQLFHISYSPFFKYSVIFHLGCSPCLFVLLIFLYYELVYHLLLHILAQFNGISSHFHHFLFIIVLIRYLESFF